MPGINAELGLGASVDIVIDTLAERAEKEIVSCGPIDKNLIGYCAPFLSKLCRNLNLMQKVIFMFSKFSHIIQIFISFQQPYNNHFACYQSVLFLEFKRHYLLPCLAVPGVAGFCNACSLQTDDY